MNLKPKIIQYLTSPSSAGLSRPISCSACFSSTFTPSASSVSAWNHCVSAVQIPAFGSTQVLKDAGAWEFEPQMAAIWTSKGSSGNMSGAEETAVALYPPFLDQFTKLSWCNMAQMGFCPFLPIFAHAISAVSGTLATHPRICKCRARRQVEPKEMTWDRRKLRNSSEALWCTGSAAHTRCQTRLGCPLHQPKSKWATHWQQIETSTDFRNWAWWMWRSCKFRKHIRGATSSDAKSHG